MMLNEGKLVSLVVVILKCMPSLIKEMAALLIKWYTSEDT